LISITACQSRPVIIYPDIGLKPYIPEPDWIQVQMTFIDDGSVLLTVGDESSIVSPAIFDALRENLIDRIAYTGLLQNDIDYYVTTIKLMGEDES